MNREEKSRRTNRPGSLFAVFLMIMPLASELPRLAANALPFPLQIIDLHDGIVLTDDDSVQYATVVIYRPDDQLSRKYQVQTNIGGAFDIARKETVRLDARANTFNISIDAFGHKKETFLFELTQGKVHYFRIQDRNNYAGTRPFIEVIEVTEETFRREIL